MSDSHAVLAVVWCLFRCFRCSIIRPNRLWSGLQNIPCKPGLSVHSLVRENSKQDSFSVKQKRWNTRLFASSSCTCGCMYCNLDRGYKDWRLHLRSIFKNVYVDLWSIFKCVIFQPYLCLYLCVWVHDAPDKKRPQRGAHKNTLRHRSDALSGPDISAEVISGN